MGLKLLRRMKMDKKPKIEKIDYSSSVFLHIKDDYGNEIRIPIRELELFKKVMNKNIDVILRRFKENEY